jgi:signal transduction histidine kinase
VSARGVDLEAYVARYSQPLQVYLGPAAEPAARRLLDGALPPQARLLAFRGNQVPALDGPAVLVLAPPDLAGPHRARLLDLARAARPGRPILYGSSKNRDALLDAINSWRIFRIVPEDSSPAVLIDAVLKAHEAIELERGLERAAEELRAETTSLEEALQSLEQTQDRLRHAERLATLGRITSSLIPIIGAHLEALQEFNALVGAGTHRRDARLEELLGYAFTGIRALHAMLDEIRGYGESRPEAYRLELEDVDGLVKFAVSFSGFDPLARQRHLRTDLRSGARIRGDCFRLYQTFINLLRNAFQATPPGGEVTVRTFVDGKEVVVDVENTGPPISPEVQAHIFEPFFTTKGDQGMGLGLSMCRTTIERHGGTITCRSAPGQKTTFRIRLPKVG